MKEKLAIVGTGIAGMSCAYFLKDRFNITVFEKNNYIGGHTNTIKLENGVSFDTGFMVFNNPTYPLLTKLFNELSVETYNTDMSFSVRNNTENIEYNGSSLSGLFSQRKNILSFRFVNFLLKVNRFNYNAPKILDNPNYDSMSIDEYVAQEGLGQDFLNWYLVPMSSAVWSTPPYKIKKFPIKALVRFFKNHGFLGLNTQHQWKTVQGGSIEYRKKLTKKFEDKIRISTPVLEVESKNDKVIITSKDGTEIYDKVIMASHADEALQLIKNPSRDQNELLSAFQYQENLATIHTDSTVMPKSKKNWSSWNFISKNDDEYVVYYMNRLQKLSSNTDYFISINGSSFVDKSKVLKQILYHHPIFDVKAWKAQTKLHTLNQKGPLYFCGAYFRYGFHEDGLWSAHQLCESLNNEEKRLEAHT